MVILYADAVTPSMARAMEETQRRRDKQDAYNQAHGITPRTVKKSVRELMALTPEGEGSHDTEGRQLTRQQRMERIAKLEKEMKEAAKMLEFELAAMLRDQIIQLRGEKK